MTRPNAAGIAAIIAIALLTTLALWFASHGHDYCHSETEDGPILDCDYQGDTNTWEPR